jgi:midasin (ATPase involved in ribosome maturation)
VNEKKDKHLTISFVTRDDCHHGFLKRLFVLRVAVSLFNEPVLLVGETGKDYGLPASSTRSCRVSKIADCQFRHQHTETSDLLGAYVLSGTKPNFGTIRPL